MSKDRKIAVIIVILVLLLASGCLRPRPHLRIIEDTWSKGYIEDLGWVALVEGRAENDGSVRLEWAEVRAEVYDADDSILGISSDFTKDLGRYEVWNFSIHYQGETEPGSYEVSIGVLIY